MTDPTHNSAGRDVDKPKRMPLWLRLLVVISLAGNLLFAGLVAGAVLRAQSEPKVARNRMLPPQASMVIGGVVFWDLDRQERRALRRLAEGQKGSVFKHRRKELERLLAIIGADTFDLVALRQELELQMQSRARLEHRMEEAWIAHLQAMSAPDRKALAARVEDLLDRPKRRHLRENGKRPPVVDRGDP
jgi:uncharacterized membrane protein